MSSLQHLENEDANQGGLPEEKLMAYLEGRLSGNELREVELFLAEENMEGDALEGLQSFSSNEAKELTNRLNQQLNRSLKTKKRRGRRGMMDQQWTWTAIVVILLLAIICFGIVWVMTHR